MTANYKYEVSPAHNVYENMTVYDRYRDGVPSGWRVEANDGFVMYQENEVHTEIIDGEETTVIYYCTVAMINPYFNWDNFDFVAVPRDSVKAQ